MIKIVRFNHTDKPVSDLAEDELSQLVEQGYEVIYMQSEGSWTIILLQKVVY